MTAFLAGLGFSALAVFIAEMGDKTQLVAMSLATRYRALTVILGITAATAVVHIASVFIAEVLGASLPTDWITLVAGIAFLIFGAWTLRGDEMSAKDEERAASRRIKSAFVTVFTVFFIAELGDKTMLTTIAVGTQYDWLPVWLGSTVGMVAADAIAIVLGAVLGRKLPERAVRIGAASLFFVAGAVMVGQGVLMLLA
ncbi:TMEM165/GDT1 family protein [Nocardiopsis changdeensis]|uniref:GDT1 family protein n=1 Tax=Nocardiopsis changdeensis TaxID=2831969 RepID=A0ABX8BN61_9ACTN|nr:MULTISPECIES: TMEM165/GDT1 family protein [Nocardiopsis]QUX22198.1 TMEM165/GDT1 family protein [Nocardiopsis changdeensis]QYX38138.1 TMEM165/GDT1 family protein [Nocardiopsis sp. MT53]